jgi:uncharacterized protein (DUF58 family)
MPRLSSVWPAPLRRRLEVWLRARHPRTDTQRLTHRNVYILPTKAGLLFGITMLTLLLASINYQLNLGYALTFLLTGSALASMHLTHNTLRGLTLHLRPTSPTFASQAAALEVVLQGPPDETRDRFGIGLRLAGAPIEALTWVNVAAGAQTTVQLSFVPPSRGRHAVPQWTVETRFPLGLFRAWAVWRPAAEVLVYPTPEAAPPPLPQVQSSAGGGSASQRHGRGDMDGVRSYRRGDPVKAIVWKKAAQALASGAGLVSRDSQAATPTELWLDWQACPGLASEARLSRLAAWVVQARQMDIAFGLRLPERDLELGSGDAHRHAALQALALWS